ncbi:MAG TPA: M20/M25/M40 family metallo-hydrolase [Thermoanaerobaculia bacterium]|nr:M20/M25/M40 family metallo-hydrolase [Thermoanaerobaculia bacterium]
MIDRALWARAEARLATLDVAGLAAELVRIPSHPGVARQEEAVARRLADWLAEQGVAARLDEVAPGRPNVIARVGDEDGRGRTLMLCGHTDTVPLNAADPGHAFRGEIRDGRLLGRGAADMKGPVAAMAAALVALDGVIDEIGAAVVLAAVVDEEMESLGAEALARALQRDEPGVRADVAVVGEPTGNRVALGHKGLEWLAVELHGRAAHGGTPERGVNAILAAARFVALVEERLLPSLLSRAHPLLGPPTLNLGTIRGGDQPSTVAASCVLTLDRRSVPGESFDSLSGELEALLAEVERAMPGLRTRLRRVDGGMATMEHVALVTAADHPLARAAFAARAFVLGEQVATQQPIAFPAWTDGALLARFGGLPTIVLGPGDLADAHSPRESIAVAELETAARLYAALALELVGGATA